MKLKCCMPTIHNCNLVCLTFIKVTYILQLILQMLNNFKAPMNSLHRQTYKHSCTHARTRARTHNCNVHTHASIHKLFNDIDSDSKCSYLLQLSLTSISTMALGITYLCTSHSINEVTIHTLHAQPYIHPSHIQLALCFCLPIIPIILQEKRAMNII